MLLIPLRVKQNVHALQTETKTLKLFSSGHVSREHQAAAERMLQCSQKTRLQHRLQTYILTYRSRLGLRVTRKPPRLSFFMGRREGWSGFQDTKSPHSHPRSNGFLDLWECILRLLVYLKVYWKIYFAKYRGGKKSLDTLRFCALGVWIKQTKDRIIGETRQYVSPV